MREYKRRIQNAATRLKTRLLRFLGVRERVLKRRSARERKRRLELEARGEDRLSKPALHELDVKLDAIIGKRGGFFIEAGAHDGYTQSNTYWLERFRDWHGLLVEPMPEMAAEARLSRPDATVLQCALVAADDPRRQVRMRFGDLMSMVEGAKEESWPGLGTILGWRDPYEIDVDARSLSSILDQIGVGEVDLLSLDTEGFEAQVLRGVDLERHAPRYLLVEVHDRERDRPPVDRVLGRHYREHSWLSPVDLLYVREDVAVADGAPPYALHGSAELAEHAFAARKRTPRSRRERAGVGSTPA
jgi:FkbM family methyltransferase